MKAAGFNYPCRYYYTREDAPEGSVWNTTSEDAPIDYNRTVYAKCSCDNKCHEEWCKKNITKESKEKVDEFIKELKQQQMIKDLSKGSKKIVNAFSKLKKWVSEY